MNVVDSVGNQINNLLGCIGNSCLLHGCRVVPKNRSTILKNFAGTRFPVREIVLFTCVALVTGMIPAVTGTSNSFCKCLIQKTIVNVIIKKTSVWSDIHSLHPHFFFQMIQIFIHIGSLRMSLRITCTADTEISCLFDLADQFNRMVILIRKRKIRVCRNIPAKCKDAFRFRALSAHGLQYVPFLLWKRRRSDVRLPAPHKS